MSPLSHLGRRAALVAVAVLVALPAIAFPLAAREATRDSVYWSRSYLTLAYRAVISEGGGLRRLEMPTYALGGVLVERVAAQRTVRTATADAMLYGISSRPAVALYVYDNGGQWNDDFSRPTLVLESVGNSAESVTRTTNAVLRTARADLRQLQSRTPPSARVVLVEPATGPRVEEIKPRVERSMAGAIAAGLLCSLLLAWGLRRRVTWPRPAHDDLDPAPAR